MFKNIRLRSYRDGQSWFSLGVGFGGSEGKYSSYTYQLEVFTEGYFGLRDKIRVHVDHFHGYSSLRYQSIDVGVKYTFEI